MGSSKQSIQLHIGGMTCINCQNKIEEELRRTDGIVKAGVSYQKGMADIVYDAGRISPEEIIAVIEKLDYKVLREEKRQETDLPGTVCMLVVIVALYRLLQSMGILNLLAPSQLADTGMGYGMLFVIGLITSVHCVAMCGGINISQCIPTSGEAEHGRFSMFFPSLAYNLGRVVSYTAVGFLLGLAGFFIGGGAEVGVSAGLQGILKIVAGVFMVVMGINMLGLFPWLRRFTIRTPRFFARAVGEQRRKSSRPFFVGILNGFMPCGPLQSMWIVALAAGNPFSGALSMLLFSLGTVPLMLGLGSAVSALGKKFTHKVMTVGAVLVVVLGLAMISQGGALSGWLPPELLLYLITGCSAAGVLLSIPVRERRWREALKLAALLLVIGSWGMWHRQERVAPDGAEGNVQAEVVDGVQVVNSVLAPGRYPSITVQAGVPVQWVIDAPEGSINGCNYRMMVRDYDIEYTFHTGENVVEFTPEKAGTVRYSCWMGMIYGNIFVTDGSERDTPLPGGEVSVPTPSGYEIPTDRIEVASRNVDSNGNPYQEIHIALTDEGFSPAVVVVQKDMAAVWAIDNQRADAGAGVDFLVPYYSTKLVLGEGVNQLSLYPAESFDVSTGDHRFYCYVKVVDDLDTVDEAAVKEEVEAYEPLIYPAEIFERPPMSCCGG